MSYEIGIIGTGYVGLVSGTTFAATGNNVLCIDIDEAKVNKMRQGICPIYEPGLDRLMEKNIEEGRLHFSTNLGEALDKCLIVFLCLPTPPNEDGSADLNHVLNASKVIANYIKDNNIKDKKIIVNKSTVPVGTGDKVKAIFKEVLPDADNVFIVSNPEFLSEGFAIEEATYPDRVVIGTDSEYVAGIMKELYKPFVRNNNPILIMDLHSAELTKYASNSFLATKISFMNELSRYCEAVGADIDKVRIGMGSDPRIGNKFIYPGVGFGGSCFPKDVRALSYSAKEAGTPLTIIESAQKVNDTQLNFFFDKITRKYGSDLSNKAFALWGLSFKPETDDVREAPAYRIIDLLLSLGAKVKAYDPEAIDNTRAIYGDKIEYSKSHYECLDNTDALIIATEWTVFRSPDMKVLLSKIKDKTIFDGRNVFEVQPMKELGFDYYSIGR
jgi:UDPglucose 6-dehydrogenase